MNLSGLVIRYITDCQSGSFLFNNIQTSAVEILSGTTPSGQEFRIGFSGITGHNTWYFSFKNGKVYDPEGRWFGAYDETSINSISGNFNLTDYDYYWNNEIICATGKKTPSHVNCWFASGISGGSATADIKVNSGPINLFLDMQQGFYLGQNWSGSLYHDSFGPVAILSGEIFAPDSSEFTVFGTGLSYCNGNNVIPSGGYRTVYFTHTGSIDRTGTFILGVKVYTDFGPSGLVVTGSGIIPKAGFVGNSLDPSTGWNFTYTGGGDTGLFSYHFSTSLVDLSGVGQPKPFGVSLTYNSGYTGVLSPANIAISNPGAGYTIAPTVYISPTGGGYPIASGAGIISAGQIFGISWASSGVYTGNIGDYSLVIVGGNGAGFAASAYFPTSYTKTFTGYVTLDTGVLGQIPDHNGISKTMTVQSGSGLLSTDTSIVVLQISASGVPDTLPLFYTIQASGYYDTSTDINLYSGSGFIVKG